MGYPFLFTFVFAPCSHATANMSLGLVLFQDFLHLQIQRPIV